MINTDPMDAASRRVLVIAAKTPRVCAIRRHAPVYPGVKSTHRPYHEFPGCNAASRGHMRLSQKPSHTRLHA